MVNAEIVAKWFINNVNPDPLKLQKLLYFAQGISFCFQDEPLFDDDFEAWVHGPVIPTIYQEFKEYGYNPISIDYSLPELDPKALEILNYVKDHYAKYDGKFLEEMTHHQEPWLYARSGLDPDERVSKNIPKGIIAEYFSGLMNQPGSEDWL